MKPKAEATIRLLIADDHPVVRTGLLGMLSSHPDFEVVAVAADGREALELVRRLGPDVALLDLRMPVMSGAEAIGCIRREGLATRVLVLTTYDTDADIVPAMMAGASGYLLKDVPTEELFRAIHDVAAGRSVLSPAVRGRLERRGETSLSGRELEVLALLGGGETNKAIAKRLFISEATVKTHLVHIFEKLGVDDRTAAVTRAIELGIVRLDHPKR